MKRTAIMKGTPPCQAPEQISEKVQAVSQIVNFDGKEILNMDLFYMGKLRGRYFADKEEKTHAAFADGKWYSCMINNVARVCQNLETIKGMDITTEITGNLYQRRINRLHWDIWEPTM